MSHDMHMMHHGMHDMHDMHMTFYFDYNLGDFFFSGLIIDTPTKLIALCVVLMVLGIFYEALKVPSARARALARRERQQNVASTTSTTPLVGVAGPSIAIRSPSSSDKAAALKAFTQASLFLFQTGLGYFLMLAVMLYNGFVFISIAGGMFIGNIIFGHMTTRIRMENYRFIQEKLAQSKGCPSEASTSSTLQSFSGNQPTNYGSSSGISTSTTVS